MRDTLASNLGYWSRSNHHRELVEPAAKRISTPAGQRLSVILGSGDVEKANRNAHRASVLKAGLSPELGDPPRESSEGRSPSSYTYSIWADTEKWSLKGSRNVVRRVGWKKILFVLALVIAAVVAIAVGVTVGLKKPSSNNDSDSDSSTSPELIEQGDSSDSNEKPDPTGPLAPPSDKPTDFPIGKYSFVTFLDTVQSDCTANNATWTCAPNTDYYTDPTKAGATFNWIINKSSTGKLQISSPTENELGITFQGVELELMGEGTDSERYRARVSAKKTVNMGESECEYPAAYFTALLYTKGARGYPDLDKGQSDGNPEYPVWPYAVKIEQTAGGGPGVPACKGDFGDLKSQDPSTMCSCLYRNFLTPSPY